MHCGADFALAKPSSKVIKPPMDTRIMVSSKLVGCDPFVQ